MKNQEFNSTDLKKHVLEIAYSFINQIDGDNVIHSWDTKSSIIPDAVANYHLIELLSELNPDVFWHYCNSLFSWLSDGQNGYSTHPFTLDAYTKFCSRNNENFEIINNNIAARQLKDGRFTIYTALLPGGGDYFSTLWATKILISYDKKKFKRHIELSIQYLIKDVNTGAQTISQKGFLMFLLIKYNPNEYSTLIKEIADELYPYFNDITFSKNIIEAINDIYIIEDFWELYKINHDPEIKQVVLKKLELLFCLDRKFKFPTILKKYSDLIPQAPYYQFLLRSALIGVRVLKTYYKSPLEFDLNSYLHHSYRKIKYAGEEAERTLKKYKKYYDGIESEFCDYEIELKRMWQITKSDYDHSIFIMMPFKSSLNFRTLTNVIKESCEKMGFKAFRVDDKNRHPYDILWDNLVLNMLSCKYGISIYISEQSVDRMTDELRFFQNPNVALEYGFMKSRGKKVLILKDEVSITPSDLQGFLWKPFDITNPDTSVPPVISNWLKELPENENNAT